MVVIRKEVTAEGETIPYQQTDLHVTTEVGGKNDRVRMPWPVTVAHKMDEKSPFYDLNPKDILNAQFEIIVTLNSTTEETGNAICVKTSYLPNEILWGHQFDHDLVLYDKIKGKYQVLHSRIHNSVTDDTPRHSAKQLDRVRAKRSSSGFIMSAAAAKRATFQRVNTVM